MPTPASSGSKAKALFALVIIALIISLVVVDAKRRAAESQLQQVLLKQQGNGQANTAQNQAIAKQVIEKVSRLYALPTNVQPTVATIVDVAALRKQNAFYNKAENGDYLVITPDRAILYDPNKNMIIDVVPVQLQPPAQGPQQPGQPSSAAPAAKPAPASPGIKSNP